MDSRVKYSIKEWSIQVETGAGKCRYIVNSFKPKKKKPENETETNTNASSSRIVQKKKEVNTWTNAKTNGRMNEWVSERMYGWMDGWIHGRMDRQTDARMDGWSDDRVNDWRNKGIKNTSLCRITLVSSMVFQAHVLLNKRIRHVRAPICLS